MQAIMSPDTTRKRTKSGTNRVSKGSDPARRIFRWRRNTRARSNRIGVIISPDGGGPAKDAVFETAELLEMILTYVDFRTLLVSVQRVNKAWQAAVINSSKLQKKLFFHPVTLTEAKQLGMLDEFDSTIKFKDWKPVAALNTALVYSHKHGGSYEVHLLKPELASSIAKIPRGRQSWERMLLCSPPRGQVTIRRHPADFINPSRKMQRYGDCRPFLPSETRACGPFASLDMNMRLGELVDHQEEDARQVDGVYVNWHKFYFEFCDVLMMGHRVLRDEGVRRRETELEVQ